MMKINAGQNRKENVKNYIPQKLYNRLSWIKKNSFKYYSIYHYQEIDGWLSSSEAITLYDLAKSLQNENSTILELGSWQGKSTYLFYQGIKNKPSSKIFCIDPFNADGDFESRYKYEKETVSSEITLKERFINNCDVYGMKSKVQILEGYSYEFSKDWKIPVDLLFIDANHSLKAVYRDYSEWSKFVRLGGYIVFHDVFFQKEDRSWSGPGEVVTSYLKNDNRFIMFKYIDTLFVAKRI